MLCIFLCQTTLVWYKGTKNLISEEEYDIFIKCKMEYAGKTLLLHIEIRKPYELDYSDCCRIL